MTNNIKKVQWPSDEEQLAAAKTINGSSLENLIRENQDLDMLRPEKANDIIGLPPWLRAYWHKKHPKARYSANNLSHGYSRVLENILKWILLHQEHLM